MYGVHELGHFLLAGLMPALSRDQGTLVPVFLRGEREPQGTSFLTLSGLRNRGCRPSSPGQRLGAGFLGPSGRWASTGSSSGDFTARPSTDRAVSGEHA